MAPFTTPSTISMINPATSPPRMTRCQLILPIGPPGFRRLLFSLFRQPPLQILVILLLELRERRRRINLARFVLAREKFLACPFVMDVRDLRFFHDLLRQVRRNEDDTLAVSQHHVAR